MERTRSDALSPELILQAFDALPQFAAVPQQVLQDIVKAVLGASQSNIMGRLREVELFQDLGDEDLQRLHDISEIVTLEPKGVLFEEGEKGDAFYVVLKGAIILEKKKRGGGSERLAISRTGGSFGEMALINDAPRSATATAEEETSLIAIPKDGFQGLLDTEGVTYALLKHLAKALWATSVRFTAQQEVEADSGKMVLEMSRMMRQQMLPKGTPQLAGFHVAGFTHQDAAGHGDTAWSWFKMGDGRPVLCVFSGRAKLLPVAHYLSLLRVLLREAAHRGGSLAQVLEAAYDEMHDEFIPGMEPKISVGLLALASHGIEWCARGDATLICTGGDGVVRAIEPGVHPIGSTGVKDGERMVLSTRAESAAMQRALLQTCEMSELTARGTVSKLAELVAGRMAGLPDAGDASYVLVDIAVDVPMVRTEEASVPDTVKPEVPAAVEAVTPLAPEIAASPVVNGDSDVTSAPTQAQSENNDSDTESDSDGLDFYSTLPS